MPQLDHTPNRAAVPWLYRPRFTTVNPVQRCSLKHGLPIATVSVFLMSAQSRFLVAISVTVLCVTAFQARAETSAPVLSEVRDEQPTAPKENGFTLGKLLHSRLLILVKPPLGALNQLSDSSHHSGTPPELLTPGNAGIAVHYRW
jgi:hypothetical protein